MDVIAISVAVVAVTFVILAVFTIPTFIEARKTAIAAREFLSRTEMELQPVLSDMKEIIADVKVITNAAENAGDVKQFMESLGDTGRCLKTVNTVVGEVVGTFAASSLWLTGAKVAGKFMLDRFQKKGGN